MGFPKEVKVIETMIGTRAGKIAKLNYQNLTGMKDKETKDITFQHSTCLKMFLGATKPETLRSNPEPPQGSDLLLPYMEKHNIEIAMIGVGLGQERSGAEAIEKVPRSFYRLPRARSKRCNGLHISYPRTA
ncbi:MAG: hypothetical protein CM15mP49_00010 [Actinomycetota bacterium]|nr:MAG: hypothetical protein CM15mP49_00010 [Actinomycetota bacterium]